MSSVLYDVPGPRAILRNRILGILTVLVVLALLAWVVWRFCGDRPVLGREVVRLHLHPHLGAVRARDPAHPRRVRRRGGRRARARLRPGDRAPVGSRLDPDPGHLDHRGLPRRSGAGLHDPAVLRAAGDRHQDDVVLGGRHRPGRLQRLGARRGRPRRRRVAAARPGRSGLRDRPAQGRRHAP